MRVILFTQPSDEKILDDIKTMTARYWRANPPKVGEVVRAQTGRKKETTFAYLKILKVTQWNGYLISSGDTGYVPVDVARKEGFDGSVIDFLSAYRDLNRHNWTDETRKHWFVEFEMIDEIEYDHTGGK